MSAHPLKERQMMVLSTHVTPTPTQVFMDPIDFQPFDLLSLDIEVQVACFLSTQLWRTEKQQNRDKIFLLQYITTKLNEVSIIEVKGLYRGGEI